MLNYLLKPFFPTITYGITVCNEAAELDKLLHHLIPLIDKKDEILVLQDVTLENQQVNQVLAKYNPSICLIKGRLNNDFSSFKNILVQKARKKFLFQIDADEIPNVALIQNLKYFLCKKFYADAFSVARINTVNGINNQHIEKWNWKLDENGYINFPDYQQRIFKVNGKIKWKNKVHEVLTGYRRLSLLPKVAHFCLVHEKTIERQETQNEYYDQL